MASVNTKYLSEPVYYIDYGDTKVPVYKAYTDKHKVSYDYVIKLPNGTYDNVTGVYNPLDAAGNSIMSVRYKGQKYPVHNVTETTFADSASQSNTPSHSSTSGRFNSAIGALLGGSTVSYGSSGTMHGGGGSHFGQDKTYVGTYNTGSRSYQVYTDGLGGYFYDTGSSTKKISDISDITFTKDYLQSLTSTPNTTNYLTSDLNGLANVGADLSEINSIKANQPKLMSAAELAELYGLNYDYDYILGLMNEGTDAYLQEMTEKAKRLQQDTLRNQVGLYYQYLEDLRDQRATAVNTGINRGALAAMELSQYLANQQQITNALSESNANIYELYNQALTEKAKNKYNALKDYNSLGTQLMSGSLQLNANDTQRYAADLTAASQVASANAAARAQINAARIAGQAQVEATNVANSNTILSNPILLQQYLKGLQYSNQQTQANIDYLKQQTQSLKDQK